MVYSLKTTEEFFKMRNKVISRTLMATFIGVLLVMIAGGCALLDAKATLAGYVYQNNRPMPNWDVQIMDEGGRVVASEKTNAQGHFIISDVSPGDYTVRVLTFAGIPYAGYEKHITVRAGRTEKFDIELGGEDLPELPKL
jgi:hypothetical protein